MKAKINMALDYEGKYVKIEQAVRGQEYFCLNCREKLFPSLGNKNIHHFRHKKDRTALIECELYSSGDSDFEVLYKEQSYENRIRFILDHSFNLKMRLPSLESKAFLKMNLDNLYFNVQVGDRSVFSSELAKKSKVRYVDIPIQRAYNVQIDSKKNAEILEYGIEDTVSLIQNRATLFKKLNGEFINIPYSKTNLSDEIFLMSKSQLICSDELILINQYIKNGIYIYHFCFENLTDSLIHWFKKETGYTVVPNRKWIDLIYPSTFQYVYDSILIDSERIQLKITDFSKADTFTVIDQTRKIILRTDKNGYLEFDLKLDHVYTFQLNNELCNELTIKRVKEIYPTSNYKPSIQINKHPYDFTSINELNIEYSAEGELYFRVYMEDEYPYSTKEINNVLPIAIHFPYLGTIHRKQDKKSGDLINFKLFTNQARYITVKNSEFQMVIEIIKKSNIPNKTFLINTLLKRHNNLPERLIKNIRKGIL